MTSQIFKNAPQKYFVTLLSQSWYTFVPLSFKGLNICTIVLIVSKNNKFVKIHFNRIKIELTK